MKKRYATYITFLSLLLDLIILNLIVFLLNDENYKSTSFLLYFNLFWIITSFFTGFYKIYRHTSIYRVYSKLFLQFLIVALGFFTYFSLFKEGTVVHNQKIMLFSLFGAVTLIKLAVFFSLKLYRQHGNNYINILIL